MVPVPELPEKLSAHSLQQKKIPNSAPIKFVLPGDSFPFLKNAPACNPNHVKHHYGYRHCINACNK